MGPCGRPPKSRTRPRETPPPLGFRSAALRWRALLERWYESSWRVFWKVLGLFVSACLPQRRLLLAVGWVPAGYLIATGFVEYVLARYNAAVAPIVIMLAAVPFAPLRIALACVRAPGAAPRPESPAA